MNRAALTAIAAAAMATMLGCGGAASESSGSTVAEQPKLPAAAPQALREFDAGLRALRLRGPNARARAAPRFLKAVEIDETLWEAWHNLGTIYFAQGKDEEAADAFSKALKINPASTLTLLGRAEALRRAGSFDDAGSDYREASKRAPDNAEVRVRLASMLRDQGDFDDALSEMRDALRHSADGAIYVELGMIYLAQGRDDLAELVLKRALELDDKQPGAWNALALVSIEQGKDQEAFLRFDKATSIDPGYRDARFNKASVFLDSGHYEAALKELQAVVNADPRDYGARVALGVAERALKRYPRARASWEGVVEEAPAYSGARGDALWNLAVLELDIRKNEAKGKIALDRYLQNAPRRHPKRKQAVERLQEIKEMGE